MKKTGKAKVASKKLRVGREAIRLLSASTMRDAQGGLAVSFQVDGECNPVTCNGAASSCGGQ